MPFTWHGLPLAPALAWVALSAYCALFPAAWVWIGWTSFDRLDNISQFLRVSALRRQIWFLVVAALWAALEFMRGRFLSGFPWNFLGVSQYRLTPLIQIASITGIHGVSFLVVWLSVAAGGLILSLSRSGPRPSLVSAGAPLLVVVAAVVWGFKRMDQSWPTLGSLRVAMVQPGVAQTEIWDASRDQARFNTVLALSQQAMRAHPSLVLWPESGVPDLTPEFQRSIAEFVERNAVWAVFCAGTAEATPQGTPEYFNSALMCGPEGTLEGIYHKRRLVIFGEYIPLVHWLPFLKWLTPVGGEVTPGVRAEQFELQNPRVKLSVLICFEDMFPDEARQHVEGDTDFLVNLTNDGWFGHADEQWQQAASAIFRAVENGVPILRCTNDGVTCWADAQGRLHGVLYSAKGNFFDPGVLMADVPLPAGRRAATIYNRFGDWFPWGCAIISAGWVAWARFRAARRDSVQK